MSRTTARIAALSAVVVTAGLVTAGTASASYGDDQRCEKPKGVVVVCTADEVVDLSDLYADVDALTHVLNGHHH